MSKPPESRLRSLAVRAVRLPFETTEPLTEDEVAILTQQAVAGAAHHVNRAQLYLAELIDKTGNEDIEKHIAAMEQVRRFLADLVQVVKSASVPSNVAMVASLTALF